MILCPRTGRKPWKCLCPEHVAQRTAVGPDVSPTPNRDVGWARPRAVILSDAPVRIEGGVVTRGLYFFRRWRRAPGGDILFGADGQPQREGGPGDGGLECSVEERAPSLLRGAMHVASVRPPTVVQLFRTENSEYFALRTHDGEYTFSQDTLDRSLREMHEEKCAHSAAQPEDLFISETYCNTPRHWVERAYPMLVVSDELIAGARALLFVPPSESIELRTTDAQEIYVVRWSNGVHSFTRPALYRRAAEIAKTKGNDELAADILRSIGDPGDGQLQPPGAPGISSNCSSVLLPDPPQWVLEAQAADLVFRPETDPHLVARAVYYMWHAGLGRLEDETSLYHCAADDSYMIRQYEAASDHLRAVGMNRRTLLGYTVPPDAIPIARMSTRRAVHQALEESTKREIPFAELRAWLQSTVDRVFCAWGAGVATIGAQAVSERGLQKTGESPTMESPE